MPASYPRRLLAAAAVIFPVLAACSPDQPTPAGPAASLALASTTAGGALFVMSDGSVRNAVVAFRRAADGSLAPLGAFPTGGAGSPDGARVVPSPSSLLLSDDHRFLFAVNAGSDDVSSFAVAPDGRLTLIARAPSGGDVPVSLAVHGRLLYVLNAGDGTLHGLRVDDAGRPSPVPGSTRSLGLTGGTAAVARFTPDGTRLVVAFKGGIDLSPDGRFLLVTHKVSDAPGGIVVFPVLADGRLGTPTPTVPARPPASGIGGSGDDVLVGGEAGVLSVYRNVGGSYTLLATSPTGGTGACCVLATSVGPRVYVLNGSVDGLPGGGVAGFALGPAGALAPLGPTGIAAARPARLAPLDVERSADERYVYVLMGTPPGSTGGAGPGGAIAGYTASADGTLARPTLTPFGAAGQPRGLAAY
jgi:6-phosphogluconolactonase